MTAPALRSPLTERDFLRQVTELAEIRGWSWLHLRPAMTRDSWRTPISGPLGKGFVDLLMVRERDRRLIFAELKAEGGKLTSDQEWIISILRTLDNTGGDWPPVGADLPPWIQVFVWRPSDWPEIALVLR